jgi:hypothetical protein
MAGLGMTQEHDEDSRHSPEKSDGTRHQPNDHFDVHHDPLVRYRNGAP